MWWTSIDRVRDAGFGGFKTVAELRRSNLADVPNEPGVYLLLRDNADAPNCLAVSPGGHFKGRDPTVSHDLLSAKWVPSTTVVYVGKAGGGGDDGNGSTLRSRLRAYLRFGAGEPVGHWGGRYIWQLADAESLLVCWRATQGEVPVAVEQRLIDEFVAGCGKLPFANCRR